MLGSAIDRLPRRPCGALHGRPDGEIDIDTSQSLRREFYGPGSATIQVRLLGGGVDDRQPATAMIKIMSGANAGRELALIKALTTIGRPGHQVAVITRRPTGYFIAHVEGEVSPTLNGASFGVTVRLFRRASLVPSRPRYVLVPP